MSQYQVPGMDPLDGLANAPIFEKGTYAQNGTYKLEFQRCLIKMTQTVGLAFIVEFRIMESNNPAHPIGSPLTFFQKMSNPNAANSAINGWYAAQLGYDTSPPAMQHFDQTIRPQIKMLIQGLMGNAAALGENRFVQSNVKTIKTKKGFDFALWTFSPWKPSQGWQPQQTPAVAAEPQAPQRAMPAPGAPPGFPQQPYGAPQGQQYAAPPMQQQPYGVPAQPQYAAPPPPMQQAPYGVPAMPSAGPSPYGAPPQGPQYAAPPGANPYGAPPQGPPQQAPGPFGPPGPPNQGGWPQR